MARHLIPLCASIAILSAPASATDLVCPGYHAVVSGADSDVADRTCQVAETALAQLRACSMVQTDPILIVIVETLAGADPACVGRFLCHEGRIELLSPATLADALSPDSAYATLPTGAVFDGFLVHELTHALIYQTLGGTAGSVAQNEYIAYALQLESMPESVRETLVAPYRTDRDVTLDEFNDLMLGFAPDRYAARAWLHFSRPENGCAFIGRILDGKLSFGDIAP